MEPAESSRFQGTPSGSREEAEIRAIDVRTEAELQTREARQTWTQRLFKVAWAWLGFVALILVLQGFKAWGFSLSDAVLIAVVTTTTANILGAPLVAANYMFPRRT